MKTKTREKYYKIIKNSPEIIKKLAGNVVYINENLKLLRMKTPVHLIVYITNKCNLRCKHCFYWRHLNKKDKELTLEQIKFIVKSLKNPLESIVITGGEPFLRKDIVEICKIFEKYNKTKKIIIATNGTLPDVAYNNVKRILNETNIDLDIQISLDGLEKTHDKIRRMDGTFKRVVETVNKLKAFSGKKNFNMTLSTTISKNNVSEVEELIDFAKNKLKVFHGLQFMRNSLCHSFNVPKNIVADFDSNNGLLTIKEMEKMSKKLKGLTSNKEDPLLDRVTEVFNEYVLYILKNKRPVLKCRAGKVDGVIYSNGDVSLCEFTKPFANLGEFNFDFYRLWTSDKAKKMRKRLSKCFCIHPCNLVTSMKYDRNSLEKIFS